jgi:hypothetical protein
MPPEPGAEHTRLSLHAVAELVLAAAQHRASGTIRLRASGDGVCTVADPYLLLTDARVSGPAGSAPVSGHTPRTLAAAVGVEAGELTAVFPDGSGVGLDDVLDVDEGEAGRILGALALGDRALRAFAPEVEPVLWPEHFDVGIAVDEVNYGLSPGDGFRAEPYAYVGPWQVPDQDAFWDAPFGAARSLDFLGTVEAVRDFFAEGRSRAAGVRRTSTDFGH